MANFAELDRVVAHCAAHPEQHHQGLWFDLGERAWADIDEGKLVEDWQRHVTACVAGWTAFLHGWRPVADNSTEVTDGDQLEEVTTVAQRILGLSTLQANMLFTLTCDFAEVRRVVERFRAEEDAQIRATLPPGK